MFVCRTEPSAVAVNNNNSSIEINLGSSKAQFLYTSLLCTAQYFCASGVAKVDTQADMYPNIATRFLDTHVHFLSPNILVHVRRCVNLISPGQIVDLSSTTLTPTDKIPSYATDPPLIASSEK